jgi:hypothetical protein
MTDGGALGVEEMTMRRLVLAIAIVAQFAPFSIAQSPMESRGISPPVAPRPKISTLPRPKSDAPAKLPPDLLRAPVAELQPNARVTKFDPFAVDVHREGAHWQLRAGRIVLKDFGEYRDRAYEARRLIAELNLDEHGVIGSPEPVMEYWLTKGQSPPLPTVGRSVINFDPELLAVKNDNGSYYLGDAHKLLFNFGPHRQDAQQALAVIRKFGFNELGFIGLPNPSMSYLLNNPNQVRRPPADASLRPRLLPQIALRHPLDVPGAGRVGESRNFDPMRLDVVKISDGWHLTAGAMDLGLLGPSEYQARNMIRIAQRFPFTEQVRIGSSDFTFFLSHHLAPRGAPLGIHQTSFKPNLLTIKQASDHWVVTDGKQSIAALPSPDDAKQALAAIRHFGFNCVCEPGQGLKFLVQDR